MPSSNLERLATAARKRGRLLEAEWVDLLLAFGRRQYVHGPLTSLLTFDVVNGELVGRSDLVRLRPGPRGSWL